MESEEKGKREEKVKDKTIQEMKRERRKGQKQMKRQFSPSEYLLSVSCEKAPEAKAFTTAENLAII